jgi:hypothetical protein
MSEANAFWTQAKIGADNLGLEILVSPDGKMSLRHKRQIGDPLRTSDAEVATFRGFLSRHRHLILEANGVQEKVDPEIPSTAGDARTLKLWLEQAKDSNVILRTVGGDEIRFAEVRERMLANYKETAGWVLAAYRLFRALPAAVHWREGQPGSIPEHWADDWGLPPLGDKSPPEPPTTKVWAAPFKAGTAQVVTEETLFDE